MQRQHIQQIIHRAALQHVPEQAIAAVTWILHEALIEHDIACGVEFERLAYDTPLADRGSAIAMPSFRTVVGIRVGDFLFNARGQDPWRDALRHIDQTQTYGAWSRENAGHLGREFIGRWRGKVRPQMNRAIQSVLLELQTQEATGTARSRF